MHHRQLNALRAKNIPHLYICSMSFTFLFPVSFSRHDTVATFLHNFMHRFPRLLMNPRFMLILSPFVPRYLLHPPLLFHRPRFPVSPYNFGSDPPLSPDTPSVPLYFLFIRWFFVRSRSAQAYIHIDPHASNLHLRVITFFSVRRHSFLTVNLTCFLHLAQS